MKKFTKWVLMSAMVLSLTACSNKNSESETEAEPAESSTEESTEENTAAVPTEDDVVSEANQVGEDKMAEEVTMVVSKDIATLGPFDGEVGGRTYMLNTIYERLGVMDSRGEEVTLVLAKSCEKVEPRVYELELYDYIEDTAGNPITAEDVAFCYNTCLDKSIFQALVDVDTVEAVSDYVVRITLKTETMGVLTNVLNAVPIVSQAAYESSEDGMATNPIGTTGYVCTEFTAGSGCTFEYQGTWQEPDLICKSFSRNVKKINYVYISETAQMRMALETGKADICLDLSAADLDVFDTGEYSEQYDIHTDMDNRVLGLLYNCDANSACSDLNLRQAIAYAIDRDAINEIVYGGAAAMPNTYGGVMLGDYNPEWDTDGYYDYDLDMAAEKLAESNYNGETLRIMTANIPAYKSDAELVSQYLTEIGIKSELVVYEDSNIESIATDATAWDIYITTKGAEDYLVNLWMRWVPASTYNGTTQNFIDDEKLQQYYNDMSNVETYSVDLVNEANQYMEDMCYAYALVQAPAYTVYNSELISDVAVSYKGWPLANACNYIVE